MISVLRLVFKEKRWLTIALGTMLMTAGLVIVQAFAIAKVITFTTQVEGAANSEQLLPDNNDKIGQLQTLYRLYQKEGNRAAIRFLFAQRDFFLISLLASILFIFLLLYQVFNYLRDFSCDYLSVRVTATVRKRTFAQLMDLPSSFYRDHQSGDIISRTLNDINGMQQALLQFLEAGLFGPIITSVGFFTLIYLNPRFTVILLLVGLVVAGIIHFLSKMLKQFVVQVQKTLADITLHTQQTLFGIDIIKVFNRGRHEKKRFQGLVDQYLAGARRERTLLHLNRPITEFFGAAALITVTFYGAGLIWKGELSSDDIFQFAVLILYISPYVQKMGKALLLKQQIDVYAGRLDQLLSHPRESNGKIGSRLPSFSGRIEFAALTYRYPHTKKDAIHSLNLRVEPGTFVAIVGPSGSGKTTLIHLLPRLLEPTSGTILFDGQNYRDISLWEVRRHIAYVSQDTILFPGTIRENILYGNSEAGEKEMITASKRAHIHDFIQSREGKYDAVVGERGLKLSGGQKQRLCIARAILKRPRILLLDEATSALDTESEKIVQQAFESLIYHQTTFVIAHRLSTVKKASLILVLEQGRFIETGSHEELIKKDGVYAKFYRLQFSD